MELQSELAAFVAAQRPLSEGEAELVRDAFHFGVGVVMDVLRTSPSYPACDSALQEIGLDLGEHLRHLEADVQAG